MSRQQSEWIDAPCPKCGGPARWRWIGLDLVEESGDESLAEQEWRHHPPATEDELAALQREIHQLRHLIAAYGRTADEQIVYPGLRVWCAFHMGRQIVAGVCTGACMEHRIEVRLDEEIDLTDGGGVMTQIAYPHRSVVYASPDHLPGRNAAT